MSGPLLQSAQIRLDEAARLLGVDTDVVEILRQPKETLKARLVVPMDDGSRRAFTAWRCRYDDALGPTKGGVRFHPDVSQDEVESLAFWMTIKCAVAGLPYGGGKGGVRVDPDRLSEAELERLSRAYVHAFRAILGPERDIPAPDVGTDAKVMGWMADEYAKIAGAEAPAVVTGKPTDQGGSAGRQDATSLGGFVVLRRLAERLGLAGDERVAVQGLGAVGLKLAELLAEAGYRIVAVSDSKTSLLAPDGLDIAAVAAAKREGRALAELADGVIRAQAPEAVLTVDADILVPAALENAITVENAADVRARIILEMANGPTTSEAETALAERGVAIVPDVLANSGGVIVSYFEWLQNRTGETWPIETINRRLSDAMTTAADEVLKVADEQNLTLRRAAYAYGVSRLAAAHLAPAEKSTLLPR